MTVCLNADFLIGFFAAPALPRGRLRMTKYRGLKNRLIKKIEEEAGDDRRGF